MNEAQCKLWKPKTQSKISVWPHVIYGLRAPPGIAVWKSEAPGCNCSKHKAPHVGRCGSSFASVPGLTKDGGCGRTLYLGHHTFVCLHSSTAALVPWDSAALSGQCSVGTVTGSSRGRGGRREVMFLQGRPELPPPSARNVGIRWKGHKTRHCWDTHTR